MSYTEILRLRKGKFLKRHSMHREQHVKGHSAEGRDTVRTRTRRRPVWLEKLVREKEVEAGEAAGRAGRRPGRDKLRHFAFSLKAGRSH